ncbi:hypothetical protein BH09PSE5_BH09PSE5_37550 [soil metagenome]
MSHHRTHRAEACAPSRMHRIAALAALAMATAAAWSPAKAQATSAAPPEALVKAAQAEGRVMMYSSEDESQQRLLLEAFEKRYGIKGSFIRFPTGPLLQRFNTEDDARSTQADIVSVSSPIPFEAGTPRFAPLDAQAVPNLARWPKASVKPNYFVHTVDIVALVYNTNQLKPDQVPKTWTDLTDPKWKGKFLLTDPQVADNYMGWLDAVERTKGVDLLRKLSKQEFKLTQSGASGVQMIAAGAYQFNAPTFAAFSTQLIAKKAPIAITYLNDPAVVSERLFGIALRAPHPNAARLLANWIMSDEGVKLYCTVRKVTVPGDVDGSKGCEPPRPGVAMRFDMTPERRLTLARELGVAN